MARTIGAGVEGCCKGAAQRETGSASTHQQKPVAAAQNTAGKVCMGAEQKGKKGGPMVGPLSADQ